MLSLLPEQNNLYGVVFEITITELVNRFKEKKFELRKSSWTDFEVRSNWAEIVIVSQGETLLLSGRMEPASFNFLETILRELKVRFELELYDQDGTMVKCTNS